MNVTADPHCSICLDAGRMQLMDRALNLFKCADCNHTITAFPEYDPDLYSEEYYSRAHKNWFAHPNFRLFSFIRKKLPSSDRPAKSKLLDVGCGNGDFLRYLAAETHSIELYGVDTADCQVPGVRFTKGDFFEYRSSAKFDVVTNLTVIEHIENVRLFLQKIHDLLGDNGMLVTTTNNNDGLLYRIARVLKKIGMPAAYDRIYSSHHVQHFTNKSLRRLLESSGFEVVSAKNHNYPLKAVDTPQAGFVTEKLYRLAVLLIFSVSSVFNNGFLQTFICRKKAS